MKQSKEALKKQADWVSANMHPVCYECYRKQLPLRKRFVMWLRNII